MPDLHFLIIDGYPAPSREKFRRTGVKLAWEQYRDMLHRHMPGARYQVLLPSDANAELAAGTSLESFDGVLWTGCNLTIFELSDERVVRMIELGRRIYELGVPSYGSCWGLQIAVVAAGGEVQKNPRGREMGLARKIHLTAAGRDHPFYRGKPAVFDGFISHYDEVTRLPPGAVHLATNDFTRVQAAAVTHGKGTFWAVQYHPEYDLHEMARLLVAREERMLREGFFADRAELPALIERMEALHRAPGRKDLRWQLGIDDDVLDADRRQIEFANWLRELVVPTAARRRS